MTEIYNLSTLCRCCHTDGDFKRLDVAYQYKNRNEVYENLLQETLGIKMNNSFSEVSYSICDECIMELRAATRFQRQVLDCEQKFYEYCQNERGLSNLLTVKVEVEDETENINNDNSVYKNEIDIEFDNDCRDAPVCESENIKSEPRKPANPRINTTLEVVIKTEDGEMYSCKECGGNYAHKSDLKKHISDHHKPTFKCQKCPAEYTKKKQYNKHMKTHRENVVPQCQFCGKTFTSLYVMKQHIIHQHSGEKKSFICDVCKKQFGFKNSLARHMLEHTGMKKKFICDACGLQANDVTNLKIHILTVHQKVKRFECNLCDKKFYRNRLLKHHILRHSGIKPFECKMCPERFDYEDQLKRHRDGHYARDQSKIYKCIVCEKIFEDRFKLKRHSRTHKRSLPHKCTECNKDFVSRYSYNRHVLVVHTPGVDKKPFECDICQLRFSTKHVLLRHKESKHNPNLPEKVKLQCGLCKQSVYDIEGHMKTHTVRPFSCDYCGKTYPTKSALNRHLKDHLSTVTFHCDACPKVFKKSIGLEKHRIKAHKIVPKEEILECCPVVTDHCSPNP